MEKNSGIFQWSEVWINYMTLSEFKTLMQSRYRFTAIDEISFDPLLGPEVNRAIYRWWRLCCAIEDFNPKGEFTVLDVGAYPFTAMKVVKTLYPQVRLLVAGLWDEKTSSLLRDDPVLGEAVIGLSNLDPWITVPAHLESVPTTLSIQDQSVDFVIFTEVVEHLYNPAHALKEIFRVLRPGGRLYMTTNNISYWFHSVRLLKGETNLDHDLGQITVDFKSDHPNNWRGHVRFYSLSQLCEMLRLAGLTKIIVGTTYDTTEVAPGSSIFKIVKAYAKSATNSMPFMRKLRGHLEVVAAKS